MLSKKVIAKCLKDTVLECHSTDCKKCKYHKYNEWCLSYMQTDKICEAIKIKSFNINIFGKYKFVRQGKYSYIDEYGNIVEEKYNHTDKISGDRIIDFIKLLVNERDLIEIHFFDNKLYYSTFNPDNGTGVDITVTIKEMHNGQKANK